MLQSPNSSPQNCEVTINITEIRKALNPGGSEDRALWTNDQGYQAVAIQTRFDYDSVHVNLFFAKALFVTKVLIFVALSQKISTGWPDSILSAWATRPWLLASGSV